jgi:hypothetical protein
MNTLLLVSVIALHLIVAAILQRVQKLSDFYHALRRSRFPSLHVPVVLLLLQPSISSGLHAMILIGSDVAWQTFVFMFILTWVAQVGFIFFTLLVRFGALRFLAQQQWRRKKLKKESELNCVTLLRGYGQWIDKVEGSGFVQHYKFYFLEYKDGLHWFFMVELLVPLFSGVLDGIAADSPIECTAVLWSAVVLYFLSAVLHLAIRPYAALFDAILATTAAVFQFLTALFFTIYRQYDVQVLQPIGQVLLLISVYLVVLKAFISIVIELYGLYLDRELVKAAREADEHTFAELSPEKRELGVALIDRKVEREDSDDERFVEHELLTAKQPNSKDVAQHDTALWMAEPLPKAPPPTKKQMQELYDML